MDQASRTRPRLLTLIAIGFLLLPVGNYVAGAILHSTPLFAPRWLRNVDLLGWVVMLFPFAVGAGLLLVRRWGWGLFMAYAPLIVYFNLRSMTRELNAFNTIALAETVVAFALVGYFARRDIYAPFLASDGRGWRRARRRIVAIDVLVDGVAHRIRDLSEGGCFIEWRACPLAVADVVELRFELEGRTYQVAARVTRTQESGAGFALGQLGAEDRRHLARAVRR